MAGLTQEQKDKVINEAQKYGWVDSEAFKNKVNTQYWAWSYDTLVNKAAQWVTTWQISWDLTKANQELWTNVSQEQVDLWKQISTWIFSAEQAKRYNDLTWSQTWARDLALSTQQWANNIKTNITQEEVNTMSSEWVTPWQNITIPETVKAPEVKPTTTTETKTSEVKPQKIETIEQFKQKGANLPNLEQFIEDRYWTTAQQETDWVTAVINWEKFKWTIDANWNPIKVSLWQVQQPVASNPDDLFNWLVGWWSVNQSDPNYKIAKTRYDNYSKYAWYSSKQFQTALNEWLILPWTQTYNDLIKDPKIKLELDKAQSLNIINWQKTDTTKVFETQSEEIANNTKVNIWWKTMTLKQAMTDWYISQDEYNQITNNSEVISKYKEVEWLKNKVNELQSQYDNIKSQVEEDIKNSWKRVSDSTKRALIANYQTKQLWPLNLAISNLNTANWTLTQLKTDASQMFATNLEIYQNQQAREQALQDLADQRKYQEKLTKEERQYSEDLAIKQLEQNYAYQYWDLNSTNPTLQNIAIERAITSMYEKYPLPGMESKAIKTQKVKDLINQGMTWTQAIAQVENEIRNSNRYKQYLASEQNKLNPTKTPDIKNFWTSTVPDYRQYNTSTKTWDKVISTPTTFNWDYSTLDFSTDNNIINTNPNEASFKNNNPTWITWNANFDKWNWLAKLLNDAWIQYTKWTNRPSAEWWAYVKFNSVEDWLNAYMVALTQAWSPDIYTRLKQWVWTTNWDNYATQIMKASWITKWTKFSDLTEEQLSNLMDNQLKRESPAFYKELSKLESQTTTTQPTQQAEAWANNIMSWQAKLSDISWKENIPLKNQVVDLMNKKSWWTTWQVQTNLELWLQLVNDMINSSWREAVTWVPSFWTNPFGMSLPTSDARNFKATLEQFKNLQFLNAVPQMKWMWALSNAEWLKLSWALSKLSDTWISDADFLAELNRIKEVMNTAYKNIAWTDYTQTWNTNQLDYNKYIPQSSWEWSLNYSQYIPK